MADNCLLLLIKGCTLVMGRFSSIALQSSLFCLQKVLKLFKNAPAEVRLTLSRPAPGTHRNAHTFIQQSACTHCHNGHGSRTQLRYNSSVPSLCGNSLLVFLSFLLGSRCHYLSICGHFESLCSCFVVMLFLLAFSLCLSGCFLFFGLLIASLWSCFQTSQTFGR